MPAASVDWLAFLRRFGLNGVLCDDMGLGKTLQALCVLAAAAHDRREAAASAAAAVAAERLPSLVVCPSTLTGHWIAEAAKFCGERLHAVAYVGNAAARARLLPSLPSFELVVMSYEHLRSDIQQLEGVRWDYVVLDEGHVIRNAKSKLAQAAKRLSSCRRLILSGTPLQNHAVELWSLFDFLMPGYLGTQAGFQASYARPIHASMGARAGEAAQLEGEAALARLHRQVLPFCLRRTKESVLSELPAKIIEDRLVELHPVQRKLYAAYTAASAPSDVVRAIDGAPGGGGGGGKETAAAAAAAARRRRAHLHRAPVPARCATTRSSSWAPTTGPPRVRRPREGRRRAGRARVRAQAPALQQILLECGIGGGGGGGGGGGPAATAASAAAAPATPPRGGGGTARPLGRGGGGRTCCGATCRR